MMFFTQRKSVCYWPLALNFDYLLILLAPAFSYPRHTYIVLNCQKLDVDVEEEEEEEMEIEIEVNVEVEVEVVGTHVLR